MMRMAVLRTTVVLLTLSAVGGFAQSVADTGTLATQQPAATSEPAVPTATVTLEECVTAAKATSPNLKLTSITQDTARVVLAQALARGGVTLG